jgi:hypothetical protein
VGPCDKLPQLVKNRLLSQPLSKAYFLEGKLDQTPTSQPLLQQRIVSVLAAKHQDSLGQPSVQYQVVRQQLYEPYEMMQTFLAHRVGDPHKNRSWYICSGDEVFDLPKLASQNFMTRPMVYQFDGGQLRKVSSFSQVAIERIPGNEVRLSRVMGNDEAKHWQKVGTTDLRKESVRRIDENGGANQWGSREIELHFAVGDHEIPSRGKVTATFVVPKELLLRWERDGKITVGIHSGENINVEATVRADAWDELKAHIGSVSEDRNVAGP